MRAHPYALPLVAKKYRADANEHDHAGHQPDAGVCYW
jgi:hypothetical protein